MTSQRGPVGGLVETFQETAFYRYADWIRHRARSIQIPEAPHMDPEEIEAFSELLRNTRLYLEYGSGGSTVLAESLHIPKIVSVESDPRFANALKAQFRGSSAHIKVMHCSIGPVGSWGRPVHRQANSKDIDRWPNYAFAPWKDFHADNEYPDTILVDGRFRVNCALTSLLEMPLNSNTLFLLDDFEGRPYYNAIEPFIHPVKSAGRGLIFEQAKNFDPDKCRVVQEQYVLDSR